MKEHHMGRGETGQGLECGLTLMTTATLLGEWGHSTSIRLPSDSNKLSSVARDGHSAAQCIDHRTGDRTATGLRHPGSVPTHRSLALSGPHVVGVRTFPSPWAREAQNSRFCRPSPLAQRLSQTSQSQSKAWRGKGVQDPKRTSHFLLSCRKRQELESRPLLPCSHGLSSSSSMDCWGININQQLVANGKGAMGSAPIH
ncbi:hypothetical protein BO71DRAFT_132031 [Aspergillus ellipticus CBS 707.79]|uniref:Uncharacterized protein n=1 Tax=Aspergillus ellipticus CBS 707.79 TaxID=1448320 RepID=A0A319CVG2_9EURO|nr:hypothetical protein BO71DRAFT_132031 [Aspergillus ellipticus CBS 707.79]